MKELDVEVAVSPSVSPYRVHRVSVDSGQRRNSDDSNVKNNMRQRIFTSKKFGASWSEQQIAAEKEADAKKEIEKEALKKKKEIQTESKIKTKLE